MARGPGGGGPMGGRFLSEEEQANPPKVTKELLKRVFSYLLPYWKQFAVVLLCIIVASIFSLMPSILTGKIIDEGIVGRSMHALVYYIVLSLAVTFLSNLIGVLQSYCNTWIAQHISFDMRNGLYEHL
ncbi:MAG: ABC transporter ATP-binding protein, partial [Firmicutes bacterium]|nr:ABC transporter ATP-binding protein [Bacillota bacterium]